MAHTGQEPIEVLLIEDNPGDVRLVKEVFKDSRLPYHLSVSKDGAEAVSFLQHHGAYADAPAPRLILLDLRDRKSTRLNSSHRTIAYAVFRLTTKKAVS